MSQTVLTESQLHLAVEKLRSEHSNTLELYKAVAGLLFFQYDCTPTTNRMYQLVRKGSMSAPAEALRLFWQELRDRSQVRMQQADIPATLKSSAGALFAQMWEEALQIAKEITEKNNQAIYVQLAQAEQEKFQLDKQLQANSELLKQEQRKVAQLESQHGALQLEKSALKVQVDTLSNDLQLKKNEYENSLKMHKDQLLLSEQRAADMERYARLEIERVRQETQKNIQNEQSRFKQLQTKMESLQSEYADLQKKYVTLQQKYLLENEQRALEAKRYEQLENKNQDLYQLLQHVERELRAAHKNHSQRPLAPSRLARQKKATRNTAL